MTKNPPLDWMPTGRTVSMRPAGKWWDAIRVPRNIGLGVLGRLGGDTGAVIEDPGGALLYWLVPPGEASGWNLPLGCQVMVLGETAHVAVPGPQCSAKTWDIDKNQQVNETYRAYLRHLHDCAGCATGAALCEDGEELRTAHREALRS